MTQKQTNGTDGEFSGFTVYDAETGWPVEPEGMSCFAFDENGSLIRFWHDEWNDAEFLVVPKEGKYVVQFGDGKTLRW